MAKGGRRQPGCSMTRVDTDLESMISLWTSGVRSPEGARRVGIDGPDVYRMLFAGELEGGPGRDGMVYFHEVDRGLCKTTSKSVIGPLAGSLLLALTVSLGPILGMNACEHLHKAPR